MQLNYRSFGEGFPLIILHGLLGSLDNWQTLARKLSEDFKVYTIDQRNHGKSPHSSQHSYQLMAEDLKTFYDEHQIDKAHIIGHSMGGKTAMQFTVNYPELVEKLIVVDIAPKAYGRGHDEIFEALFSIDLSAIENRKQADIALSKKITDFGVRQFLLKNLDRVEGNEFAWKANIEGLYNNYDNVSSEITAEDPVKTDVMVVNGKRSGYVSTDDVVAFQSLFSNVQCVELNTGHWVHAEAPQDFLETVRGFLL